jgi:hypothetical protein
MIMFRPAATGALDHVEAGEHRGRDARHRVSGPPDLKVSR